jgi:hypothetical protein
MRVTNHYSTHCLSLLQFSLVIVLLRCSLGVARVRFPTDETRLLSSLCRCRLATISQFLKAVTTSKFEVRVTLSLVVYRQSVRPGSKPLKLTTRFFFSFANDPSSNKGRRLSLMNVIGPCQA